MIYNVMFILPLVIIMVLILYGMKAQHIERWRVKKRSYMKLVMGGFLLLLGIAMLLGWI